VPPVEGEALLCPGTEHDGQRLLEPLAALDLGHPVALELDGPVAASHPDVQPSPAEDVDHRQLLGQADRVVEGQDGRRQADAHPPGPHGRGGGQDSRGDGQAVLDEMVLGQPDAVEPQLLGPGHLLDLVLDDLGMGQAGWGLQKVVGPKAHRA